MFERYTEKARRVIFFARYEASQFGSPYIESEHLLLGILREDKAVSIRAIPHLEVETIRQEIEGATLIRETISTSVDLPLSNESKRVLMYAAEEAERMDHRHVGSEHLLLGLLLEEGCFAAQLLNKRGVTLEIARSMLFKSPQSSPDHGVGVATGSGGGGERMRPEKRVVTSRPIILENEADGARLGECFSIDVPRVGEEIAILETRARVTRVIYHYEQAEYEIGGHKANLKPEKVVVLCALASESSKQ
jgi:hypothetical protein